MTEPILELDGVTKRFGDFTAVDDVSFSVRPGEILGFLGPNGAGKSTTIRMIMGIVDPDAGAVRVFGRGLTMKARRRIGFLPEERGLYKRMTARHVVGFFARLQGLGRADALRRAGELLEEHGLGHAADKKVRTLSKGMAQRVQVLSALAHEPELIILDEPFSGLDPVAQGDLEALIDRLRKGGASVIFSTHVMSHAERLSDHIVLLGRGRKLFDGTVKQALGLAPREVVLEVDAAADVSGALGSMIERLEPDRDEPAPEGRARWSAFLKDGVPAGAVLREAVTAGVALHAFEPQRPHLHDVFVQLIEDDKRGALAPGQGERP